MTITLQVNKIARQMTPFPITLQALSVGIFHFCISRPSKFSSIRFPLFIMFWSVKYTFTCQRCFHFETNLVSMLGTISCCWIKNGSPHKARWCHYLQQNTKLNTKWIQKSDAEMEVLTDTLADEIWKIMWYCSRIWIVIKNFETTPQWFPFISFCM